MYDVAIIGCGPTGATLANLLVKRGASVVIIEREREIYNLPRAVHFDDETMRVFQTVGVSEDLQKLTRINPGMKFVNHDGSLLLRWPRPQQKTSSGWHASYRLHQPDLEKLLREKFADSENISLFTGYTLDAFEEQKDFVELRIVKNLTQEKFSLKSRFIVGCDGANSLVRKSLSIEMEDFGFLERWLVIDLILEKSRPDLGDHSIQFCNSERAMTYCRNPGRRRRWELKLLQGEEPEMVTTPDWIWSKLKKWLTENEAKIERSAVYTFKSQLATKWRCGRAFVAGDAAHLTPPFMGQGMCMGIKDSYNLAWKISEILHKANINDNDEFDEKLLNSYEAERKPHAREYITTAIALGEFIGQVNKKAVYGLGQKSQQDDFVMRSIQPRLGASDFLSGQEIDKDSPFGRQIEQIMLDLVGAQLDDYVGYNHFIISRCNLNSSRKDVVVLSAEFSPKILSILDKCMADSIWIRPDKYIASIFGRDGQLMSFLGLL